ncbi:class I SAM-dependent methyltransferase [Spirochaetota bacterium]
MTYFDNIDNVNDYIKMASGYDGEVLINLLKKYLPRDSTLLELGMGPGKDLDILKKFYEVTGSDSSQVFLDLYRQKHEHADLLLLDAVTIDTDIKFDCIYSNKVLHHLTGEELKKSLIRQKEVLNDNGILFHSFWKGSKMEKQHGLLFMYYTEEDLTGIIESEFNIIEMNAYKEMENDDSIYAVFNKKIKY